MPGMEAMEPAGRAGAEVVQPAAAENDGAPLRRAQGRAEPVHASTSWLMVTARSPRLRRPSRIGPIAATVVAWPQCMLTIDPLRTCDSTLCTTAAGGGVGVVQRVHVVRQAGGVAGPGASASMSGVACWVCDGRNQRPGRAGQPPQHLRALADLGVRGACGEALMSTWCWVWLPSSWPRSRIHPASAGWVASQDPTASTVAYPPPDSISPSSCRTMVAGPWPWNVRATRRPVGRAAGDLDRHRGRRGGGGRCWRRLGHRCGRAAVGSTATAGGDGVAAGGRRQPGARDHGRAEQMSPVHTTAFGSPLQTLQRVVEHLGTVRRPTWPKRRSGGHQVR